MGRPPNPQRKVELLDDIVDYVTEHGLSDLSLRPLATAIGTSTYTLTYQFGSKEQMIRDVVARAGERHPRISRSTVPARKLIESTWQAFTTERGQAWVRFVLEIVALSRREPDLFDGEESMVTVSSIAWFTDELIAAGLSPERAELDATRINALIIGLGVDAVSTGDFERLDRAVDRARAVLTGAEALDRSG